MARTIYELQQGQKKEKDERVQRNVTSMLLTFMWLTMFVIVTLPTVLAIWTCEPVWFLAYFVYLLIMIFVFIAADEGAEEGQEDE